MKKLKFLKFVVIVAILVTCIYQVRVAKVNAQLQSISFHSSIFDVPPELTQKVHLEVAQNKFSSVSKYRIMSYKRSGNFVKMTVGEDEPPREVIEAFEKGELDHWGPDMKSVVAVLNGKEWEVAMEKTAKYGELIDKAPDEFISPMGKETLKELHKPKTVVSTLLDVVFPKVYAEYETVTYKFPWPKGTSLLMAQGGWHPGDSGCSDSDSGTKSQCAIDFSGQFDILASASGSVDVLCSDGIYSRNVGLSHRNSKYTEYWHIDKDSITVEEDDEVLQGAKLGSTTNDGTAGSCPIQVIKDLYPDAKGDSCGCWTGHHIHWIVPANEQLKIEGMTLQYSGEFSNGNWAGDSFASSNVQLSDLCGPPLSSYSGVEADWNVDYDCTLDGNETAYGNITIKNDASLTVPNSSTLNVDFVNKKVTVKDGSKMIIRNGGKID